eukprot:6212513-Pleurochrysis_carterae.AAC.2
MLFERVRHVCWRRRPTRTRTTTRRPTTAPQSRQSAPRAGEALRRADGAHREAARGGDERRLLPA